MNTEQERQEKLFRKIGEVDEKLVEEAELFQTGKNRRNPLGVWAGLAACVVLATVLIWPRIKSGSPDYSEVTGDGEGTMSETFAEEAALEMEAEAAAEGAAPEESPTEAAAGANQEGEPETVSPLTESGIPMTIMVDGHIYECTGEIITVGRCGVMDGEILSSVQPDDLPTQDDQSNFGTGFGYQWVGEGQIDVYMNEQWIRFERVCRESDG